MNKYIYIVLLVLALLALFAALPAEADRASQAPLVNKMTVLKVELLDWWHGITTPAAKAEQEPLQDSEPPAEKKGGQDLLSESTDPKPLDDFLGTSWGN